MFAIRASRFFDGVDALWIDPSRSHLAVDGLTFLRKGCRLYEIFGAIPELKL